MVALKPGEVVHVTGARRRGLAVVLGSSRDGRPQALAEDRRNVRLAARDFDDPPVVLTRSCPPPVGGARSARYRRDVAARLVALRVKPSKPAKRRPGDPKVEKEVAKLEAGARAHPCHDAPSARNTSGGRSGSRSCGADGRRRTADTQMRTETLARQFDRVLGVLDDSGTCGMVVDRRADG